MLRCLVTSRSQWRPVFIVRPVCFRFVVDRVELEQVFSKCCGFTLSTIPVVLHTHSFNCHQYYVISVPDVFVKHYTFKKEKQVQCWDFCTCCLSQSWKMICFLFEILERMCGMLHQRDVPDSAFLTTYHNLHIQHLKRSS